MKPLNAVRWEAINMEREHARQQIWDCIRELKVFIRPDLRLVSEVNPFQVKDYISSLEKAGFIKVINKRENFKVYKLVKDKGITAPRVRRDGTEPPMPINQKIWQAMKMLKKFGYKDIEVAVPDTTFQNVKNYVKAMEKAGFLKRLKAGRYLFIAEAHIIKAPIIRRVKEVYDPNTRKVMWSAKDSK